MAIELRTRTLAGAVHRSALDPSALGPGVIVRPWVGDVIAEERDLTDSMQKRLGVCDFARNTIPPGPMDRTLLQLGWGTDPLGAPIDPSPTRADAPFLTITGDTSGIVLVVADYLLLTPDFCDISPLRGHTGGAVVPGVGAFQVHEYTTFITDFGGGFNDLRLELFANRAAGPAFDYPRFFTDGESLTVTDSRAP